MDTIAGYLTYKLGRKFGLRTEHGKIEFALLGTVPGVNIGDMIVLVVSEQNGAILSLNDLTTGVSYTEQPIPPFRDGTVKVGWLIALCLFIAELPSIGHYFDVLRLQVHFSFGILASSLVFLFMNSWRRARNHNVRFMNKVQEVAVNACSDPKIWSIPEPGTPEAGDSEKVER